MSGTSTAKWLCVVSFMDLFAVSMAVPLMSAHIKSLGASHFVIGFMSSLYAALQLISGPIVGSWSDIRGRRSILMLTLLVCSLCYIILGLTSSLSIILFTRIGLGIFKHTQTLCKTMVADMVPNSSQPEVYGKLNAISSIGFMIGPAIGGHLAEQENGFLYICCIVTLLFCINIGISYMFLPNLQVRDTRSTSGSSGLKYLRTELMHAINLLTQVDWPLYWDVFALKFLLGFSQAVFYSNYSLSIQESFGVSPKWVGYTISFQGMVGAASGFSVSMLNRMYQRDSAYTARTFHCFILLTLSFLCIGIAPDLKTFVMCLVPLSASGSFLRIIGTESVLRRTESNKRGSLVGSSNSISSVARLVAPLFSGAVRDTLGSPGISVVTVFSSAVGAALAGKLLVDETRRHKTR